MVAVSSYSWLSNFKADVGERPGLTVAELLVRKGGEHGVVQDAAGEPCHRVDESAATQCRYKLVD